jgi:hypothetical protein
MYALTKLSPESRAFISGLPRIDSGNLLAVSLAKAVSRLLPRPTAELAEPKTHYADNLRAQARLLIGEVNELAVVDIALTCEYTCTFWQVAYETIYPRERIYASPNHKPEAVFFGYATAISPTLFELIESCGEVLTTYTNGFTQVLKDLRGVEQVAELPKATD